MATPATQGGTTELEPEDERRLDEIGAIAAQAVRKAREGNRRLGFSNYSVQDGRIVEELPDGSLRPVADETASASTPGSRSKS